jgi:hypothetical protein
MQIEIDFEVYKELTARRSSEDHSYNEVLRELLGLAAATPLAPKVSDGGGKSGRVIGGRFLPSGTNLRARYKSEAYKASIIGNELVSEDGKKYRTASAAAKAITNTNVNGLGFWEVKRPQDTDWKMIKALPKDSA